MNSSNTWRISTLVSACYEFVLALFLLVQMLLALLVIEVAKFLPVGRACSCSRHKQHNQFCSGHFPPFSPCRERDSGRFAGVPRAAWMQTRFPTGLLPGRVLSDDLSTSRDATEITFPRRAGLANQARSLSMSSAYKRKGRHSSIANLEESTSECKGSVVDGETCQCIAAGLDLYDDLIEVSSEYLKQKDRGHEEVILSLLKALQVERRNLRTLYEELEEERVAAETAANEAMAMILRLQEEKSALQMEADHYQRMAEEKALHDEHAIQLLAEDLCRKENERFLLEEELSELRRRSYGDDDDLDVAENMEKVPVVAKPLLLLTGIDEVSNQEEQEDETTIVSQGTAGTKCITATCMVLKEEACEGLPTEDQPLKRFKSFTVRDVCDLKDLQVLGETRESVLIKPNKHLEKSQSSDEDDAKAILVQLSAVEKQLLAFEESEKLELWHQAQASQDSLIREFLNPDGFSAANSIAKSENDCDLQMPEKDAWASETEASTMLDEERIVNVDVAEINDIPYCETHVPASEEIFDIHEGKHQRSKVVQWEASEVEKHLDLPSFVKSNSNPANPAITSMLEGTCKPDVSLPGMGEEENWDTNRVTLEGMNLRLRALESESTLLRHRSVPSNHEHVNLVLLKEIMQELQELLRANRNVSAANEALTSMSAYVKGDGQHKKRHYSDGPGQFP